MRTALRVGAIGVVILAVAAVVAFVTQRDKVLARLAASLTETLSAQLGGRVDIGRIRFDMVPLTLVVEGVTVHSLSDTVPVAPLSVDRVTVRPSLISFLTETPVIRWLRIEHPRVTMVTIEGGITNIPRLGGDAPPPSDGGPAVLIRRIDIEDAEVSYRSPTASVSLKGVSAVLYPDLVTRHVTADLTAPGGTVTIGARTSPFAETRLQIVAEGRRITVTEFSLDGAGISVSAKGTLTFDETPALDLSATGAIDLQPLLAAWTASHPLGGHLTVRARVTGPIREPTLRGDLAAKVITYHGVAVGDLSTGFDAHNGRLALTDVTGRVLGGSILGHGSLDFGAAPVAWSAEAEASRLRPAALLQRLTQLDAPLPPHEISGPLRITGRGLSVDALEGQGRLAIAMTRPAPESAAPATNDRLRALVGLVVSADIPWTLRAGRLNLDTASIATDTGRVSVTGSVTVAGDADLTLDASGQDVAAVTEALGLRFSAGGVGAFRGRLAGRLTAPTVEGRAEIRDLSLRGHPAGDLATTLRYAERTLSFRDTVWRNGEARYDTVGKLTWEGESVPGFDLTATLRRARVEDVLPIAFRALPIRAAVDGTFTFQGSPADFLISGDLRLDDGAIWGQAFDEGAVSMAINRQRISFARAALRRGESEVRGHGAIVYREGFEAQFEAPTLHLQTLNLFALNDLPISGIASAVLAMKGTFAKPEMHGSATIDYLEGAGQSLGRGRATLDVVDRRLVLKAALDDQRAELSAVLRWEPQFPLSAVLTIDNSSLVPLLRPWLPAAIADMNAALSGRIAVNGPLLQPLDWRVETRLTRLSADVGEYVVENQEDLVFTMDRGRVTVGACRLRGTDTTLTVSGSVDLFKEYDLLIVGEADLRLTRLFVPTVTSGRGKTYLVLKISDRWTSPKIQGGVTIQSAVIRTRTLRQPITVDTVGLFFNERQVVLESLEGSLGNGRVSASGQIQLTGFRPSRFGVLVDLSGIQFPLMDDLVPTFSGQLVLTGTPDAQSLRGELTIDRALYSTRLNVQEWILDLRRRAQEQAATPEAPALARGLSLNIHFTGREQISIRNNLANADLEVDLLLKGTVDHPYLIGRIETRDGTLTFRNNTYRVQSATLDFVDPNRFRPVIDLQATTTVQDYDITLQLTGTIEKFALGLTSDPSLSETDILALLTVGRTTEQVAQSEQSVGREEAASIAMDALLEEGVQRLPGVDRLVDSFQIDPRYDPELGTSTPELSVGKQLFEDRLVLRYSTTLESSGRQGVRVEYELARNVFLIGEQDSQRGFGGDIRFRFEFR
ncbi:MAG: translocation/assembly module TamB domain-containing protein [Nitrospirota bacterium]